MVSLSINISLDEYYCQQNLLLNIQGKQTEKMRRQSNMKRKGIYTSNHGSCRGFSTHIYQNLRNYTPFNLSVMAVFHYQLNLGKAQ